MKYVFFGSTGIAPIVLKRLVEAGYPPSILVCNPDRPLGRKKIMTAPETKQLVLDLKLDTTVLQPAKVPAIIPELTALEPNFFVVAAYAKIIPQTVLDIPRLGTIGVHPSLLPKYRGASPIKSALLADEKVSGVTLYILHAGVDDGPILAKEELAIDPEDTDATLYPKLANLGADMLVDLIPKFLEGKVVPTEQNHEEATLTRKFLTEDAFVSEEELAAALGGDGTASKKVHDLIRAFTPEPGAWTTKNGKRLKLLAAKLTEGRLELKIIQKEGKNPEVFQPKNF
jgi:methionyl-tRNA formyltransferase